MFRIEAPHTANPFSVLVGDHEIKWDALWNFIHWLTLPQAHGLGTRFRDRLTEYAFGESVAGESKQEVDVDAGAAGAGKWADLAIVSPNMRATPPTHVLYMDDIAVSKAGESRKIRNLRYYLDRAAQRVAPTGRACVVVLTDAHDTGRFSALRERLGAHREGSTHPVGWRLLPLRVVAGWLAELEGGPDSGPVLGHFIEWAESLPDRPRAR